MSREDEVEEIIAKSWQEDIRPAILATFEKYDIRGNAESLQALCTYFMCIAESIDNLTKAPTKPATRMAKTGFSAAIDAMQYEAGELVANPDYVANVAEGSCVYHLAEYWPGDATIVSKLAYVSAMAGWYIDNELGTDYVHGAILEVIDSAVNSTGGGVFPDMSEDGEE